MPASTPLLETFRRLSRRQANRLSDHGRIAVDWKKNGVSFELRVTIPANTSAIVYVPASSARSVKEGSVKAENAPGVTFRMYSNNAAVYNVDSGTYVFSSTNWNDLGCDKYSGKKTK